MLFSKYPYHNFSDYNLDWIINTVNEYIQKVDLLEDWKSEHEIEYLELKQIYDDLINGRFNDKVKNAFYKWMEQNALDIVGKLATTVFFGLTDSGHFVAYIPESWDDITFKTTEYDYSVPCFDEYGHLVLIY